MAVSKQGISAKNRKRLDMLKLEARQRVVKRGIVQFRADEEMMEQLLTLADYKKIPVGVLVRSWVADSLRREMPKGIR
jgi:hypothetical protein